VTIPWRWLLVGPYLTLAFVIAMVVSIRVLTGPVPGDLEMATTIYLTVLGVPWSAWLDGWWILAGVPANAALLFGLGWLLDSREGRRLTSA